MTGKEREYFEENIKNLYNNDIDKRKIAIMNLGNFSHIAAVPYLIKALKERELILYVISALGKIKDQKSVGALLNEFKTKNFLIQYKILNALEKIGDKRVVPYLKTLTHNDKIQDKNLFNKALNCLNKLQHIN